MKTKESLLLIQWSQIHVFHLLTQNTIIKYYAFCIIAIKQLHQNKENHFHQDLSILNKTPENRIDYPALQDAFRETDAI